MGRDVFYKNVPGNVERFALLAVLYGWAHAGDPGRREFLMERQPPRLAYSVDHGEFFPGGPHWNVASLDGAVVSAEPDQWIIRMAALGGVGLRPHLIAAAAERLRSVGDEQIARVVMTPPDSWGVTLSDRVAVARYLARQRDAMLAFAIPVG
jgi:hypothetical protein